MSAYLIIAGLLAVYNIENNVSNLNLINYYVTALSIIQLVLAQYENSQDYKLRAKNFHDCGLELSILYNKLRTFKTLNNNASDYETLNFCKQLSDDYQSILSRYENHAQIDYDNFKISHRSYFAEIKDEDVKKINKKYWLVCYGWYVLVIVLPPTMIILTMI